MKYTLEKVKEVIDLYKDKIKIHKNIPHTGNLTENIALFDEINMLYPDMFKTIVEVVYLLNNDVKEKFCPDGNMLTFKGYKHGYSKYCKEGKLCKELRLKNWEDNFERLHGVRKIADLPMMREKFANPKWGKMCHDKSSKTYFEKTGYKCPFHNPEVRKKSGDTLEQKCGYRHHWSSPDPQLNGSSTRQKLYGTSNIFTLPEVRKHAAEARKTDKSKQKVQNTRQQHAKQIFEQKHEHFEDLNKEFFETNFIKDNKFDVLACCEYFKITYRWALQKKRDFGINCVNTTNKTKSQQEIYMFVKQLCVDATFNDRTVITPKELDIYVPSKNLAIEFDGLLPHSSGFSKYSAFNTVEENKFRHLEKTTRCKDLNIKLFHIFENEWIEKKEIWKSMLRTSLGQSNKIFARKCKIVTVDDVEKERFLKENHLQGTCPSSVNIGLIYKNELVSLMTFGKSRFNNNYKWELLRFCSKLNTVVVGGASKLLSHFRHNYSGSVISYANRRWSSGDLYKKLGFTQTGETNPNYFYFKEDEYILWSRIKFQKHKLKNILPTYSEELSETQNMYNNGYRKIYDCGQLVFTLP